MSTNLAENQDLRRYLLGSLTDETALQQIEERILAETEFQEEMAVAESALIDEYVLGALPANEVSSFERDFLAHPTRREQLRLARALHAYAQENAPVSATTAPAVASPPKAGWFDWLFLPPVRVAASAVLLLAVGLGLWRVFLHQSAVDQGLAQLRRAYPQDGPLDVRVTELPYAPPPADTRGGPTKSVDANALSIAELQLRQAVQTAPGAPAYHALGRYLLTQKKYDEAVKQLETALQTDADNPQLHADLGAALLAQAETVRDQRDGKMLELLARSLGHLKKATEFRGDLLEARFNLALCLQYLTLSSQAREAWLEYLRQDASSLWAIRARSYLKQLDDQKTAQSPTQILDNFLDAYRKNDDERAWQTLSQTREMVTGRMLVFQLTNNFLQASIQGKGDAAGFLSALIYAGELEKKRGSDQFVGDLAKYYAQAKPNQLNASAQAHTALTEGYELCLKDSYDEAANRFVTSQQLFEEAENPLQAKVAEVWVAFSLNQRSRFKEAVGRLEQVVSFCQRSNYKWLAATALAWIGDNYYSSNETSKALAAQQPALKYATDISDSYNQQKLLTQLGILYASIQQQQPALRYHQESLALGNKSFPIWRQSWRNLTQTSGSLFRFKQYYAAAAFEKEALQLSSEKLNDPVTVYLCYAHLSSIYAELGLFDEARRNANLSLQIAHSLNKESISARLSAFELTALGYIHRKAGSCPEALTSYDQAIQLFTKLEYKVGEYEAHKGKLMCYLSMGNDSATESELEYVLGLFEDNRAKILEAQNRNAFFSGEQSVYDIAIAYQHEHGDDAQAFLYGEKARARSLLDALNQGVRVDADGKGLDSTLAGVTQPLSLDSVREQMPPKVQLIQYSMLPDKLLIWVISHDGNPHVAEIPIARSALEAKISAYLELLKASSQNLAMNEATQERAIELYKDLFAPIAAWLDHKEICIVPDKELVRLPFASLINPTNRHYLIADQVLLSSPSASVFVKLSTNANQLDTNVAENLLAIGNPAFDRVSYPDLPDLATAAREVQEIKHFYQQPMVFTDRQAQKNNILPQLPRADVIHLACHYVVDEAAPLRSSLLLASNGQPDSNLTVSEILGTKFQQTKIVTLAACQTNAENDGEGLIGLSRAFLATGVPLVIASQWSVDTEAATELMIAFHRYRSQKMPSAQALQEAQLEMLNSSNANHRSPYYWAAFIPVGGYTSF